jgi:hypothetical protein
VFRAKKKLLYLKRRKAWKLFAGIYHRSVNTWLIGLLKRLVKKYAAAVVTVQRHAKGLLVREDFRLRQQRMRLDTTLAFYHTYRAKAIIRAAKIYQHRVFSAVVVQKWVKGYI